MNKVTPFLWFNDNAEEAAEFYLGLFARTKKISELRSSGIGPWPEGKLATITLELEGQQVVFLNGGPGYALTPAFSFSVTCETQEEIDGYWEKILAAGGKVMACGWITDPFGLSWQIVPKNIGEVIKHPKAMAAMMEMEKLDIAVLEAAAQE
ncbi:MAG: VOC family protein [Acidobacteriaceae bacterium]|nr:VOC family protein [Acidobacteriaceae bacterium]